MKKHTITQLILFLLICFSAKTQPLKIGQQCPGITFTQLFNSSTKELQLSSLKGKLIIFDFWGIYCVTCIKAFPKLDSLQKKYNNRIQIIPVSKESKETIAAFFENRKKIKIPKLPFICSDTLLHQFFPHEGVPAYAWLDETQNFRFLTEGFSVNENAIEALLKKEEIKLASYQTGHTKIKNIINKEYDDRIGYLSYLTRCIIGYQEGYSNSLKKRTTGIQVKCASVTELYITAFNENEKYNFKRVGRVITDYNKPGEYNRIPQGPEYETWRNTHSYNYELVVPLADSLHKYAYMKQDLQWYFGLYAEIKPVQKKCFVLEQTGEKLLLSTKGGAAENTFFRSSVSGNVTYKKRMLINQPFSMLLHNLSRWIEEEQNLPFESNITVQGNIDISLSADAVESLDIAKLNEELKGYGLVLKEKETAIRCLLLTDKEKPVK